jgi:hypothetical protein
MSVKRIALALAMFGLVVSNVLLLTNAAFHQASFGLLENLVNSTLPTRTAVQVLENSLSSRHRIVEAEHAALKRTSAHRNNVVRSTSSKVARRAMANAIKNVSSFAAEIVPVFGTAAIIALTISDIYDDCQTLQDLNELNAVFDHPKEDESRICGMKFP